MAAPSTNCDLAPLALTMGEPGGIGAELSIKAWRTVAASGPVFFLIDDPERLETLGAPIALIEAPEEAASVFAERLPVLPLGVKIKAAIGEATTSAAKHVIRSIELAAVYALSGAAAGIVTNPIQKSALIAGGFGFPGHTEFLAEITKNAPMPQSDGRARTRGCVMMLAGPHLKSVPVTIHLPLSDAIETLSIEKIIETAAITAESLRFDFGLTRPRIAVAGLNPHAGEDGALGKEDFEIIAPAVKSLAAQGMDIRGPMPADTMFHEEARDKYDAAICMYHDQALIPAKTLDFHGAVNVTLGLPIVRTSPDHGTALDIAGKNLARPDSLIAAIRLASEIARRRRNNQQAPKQ